MGRHFKKSAQVIKKVKKEDQAVLVLRSWSIKVITIANFIQTKAKELVHG